MQRISKYIEDFLYARYYDVISFSIDLKTGEISFQQYNKYMEPMDCPTGCYVPLNKEIIELLMHEGWEKELGDQLVLSLI